MEITLHDAVTVLHGMGFGGLLLLTFSGAGFAIYSVAMSGSNWTPTEREGRFLGLYFSAMAGLAWLAVIAGAYLVYPWYRARPPAGTTDLSGYPQRLLMSNPMTAGWHDIGMEWKEHLAWFAPLCLTAVAYIFLAYRGQLRRHKGLREAAIALLALAFFATAVAGFFGAMLNKNAPVRGGRTIVLMAGEKS
ncbi:MAG TPA: hypothetical protein VMU31_05560 [Rhizomicrobium sp.]|nr:hypothetical protein [Rhizomicrobium sp.]